MLFYINMSYIHILPADINISNSMMKKLSEGPRRGCQTFRLNDWIIVIII